MIKNKNVYSLLRRFTITPCRLKNSPDYEKDMVISKGFEELSHSDFCCLVDLAYPEPIKEEAEI